MNARQIIGICLMVIGGVLSLFFFEYSGEKIPYSFVWLVASVLVILFGSKLFFNSMNKELIETKGNIQSEIEQFKKESEIIKVKLDDCEIICNNYIEEREVNTSAKVKAFDAIYDPTRNTSKVNINQSVLKYTLRRDGKKFSYYSPTIMKDEITLKFLLDKQKETNLYISKQNTEEYYFDFDFIS